MSQEVAQSQPKSMKPADAFRMDLQRMESQIKASLPAHVPVERFIRVVMTAVQKTPKILDCKKETLFAACLDAAKDGLLPDGRESAIVPFGDTANYMPMVGGILKKIRNSGELLSISSNAVKKGDTFKYWVDEKGEHLLHEPNYELQGETFAFYCILLTKDGGVYIDVMTKAQVEAIRARSRSRSSGPWVTDYDEMGKKTVIRRTSKRAPMSTDIDEMFHRDDEANGILDRDPESVATPESAPAAQKPAEKRPSRLQAAMGTAPEKAPQAKDQPPMDMTPQTENSVAENDVPI